MSTAVICENLLDPDLLANEGGPPHVWFDKWRRDEGVHWNPPTKSYAPAIDGFRMERGFWVLTRYQDVFEASRNWNNFSCSAEGVLIWDLDEERLATQRAGIMAMDPPHHAAIKRLVMPPFAPAALRAFEPEIDTLAEEIVNDIAEKGECEFVFDVASKLPVYTFCKLMGIPNEDRDQIAALGNKLVDIETPNAGQFEAQMQLFGYSMQLAEAKRVSPDNSMMSLLVNGEVDGERLTDDQINGFFVTMAIAGHETTRSTASHFMKLITEYPDQRQALLKDLSGRLANAIEEALRFCPPVIQFKRTAINDVELSGCKINKGDKVYLSYPAANRDPSVFTKPHEFDILRKNAKDHLSFGTGPHVCIAARLARRQLYSLFHALLRRLPNARVTGEPERLRSIWHDAIVKLPVTF